MGTCFEIKKLSTIISGLIFRLFGLVLFLCVSATCFAMDVTLRWDANTESNRAGYRIYYDIDSGPPYEGSGAAEGDSPIDVTIAAVETGDLAQFQLTNLDDDQIYYFAITAYDTIGNESGYSNEVSTADDVNLGDAASGSSSSGCFLSTIKF